MEIHALLKERNARGRNRAISALELASLLHVSSRKIRRWVEIERRRHFICSTADGYYLPESRADILGFKRQIEKLIEAHARTLRLVRRYEKRLTGRKKGDEGRPL